MLVISGKKNEGEDGNRGSAKNEEFDDKWDAEVSGETGMVE